MKWHCRVLAVYLRLRQQQKAYAQPEICFELWDLEGEQASLGHRFPVIASSTARIMSFL